MRHDVEPDEVRAIAEWVRSAIGVPFVIVGGSAIAAEVSVGTKDVDVLVSGTDLERADRAVERREDAYPLDPGSGTIRGTEVTIGDSRIQVDFLSAEPFGGDAFLRYVRGRGSVRYEGTLRARPTVVFYMRLSLDDWRENIPSIERDLRLGLPESNLDGAVVVARRFGRGERIQSRVQTVRRVLRELDPGSRSPTSTVRRLRGLPPRGLRDAAARGVGPRRGASDAR
jgi:hypothetical protein